MENAASVSRETCSDVRVSIESTMTKVLKLYRYGEATTPVVAFECPGCDPKSTGFHYGTLESEDRLQCKETESGCLFTSENVGFGDFCMFVCKYL